MNISYINKNQRFVAFLQNIFCWLSRIKIWRKWLILSHVMMNFQFVSWASYQIRKIAGLACTGNAGNVSPPPGVSHPYMHHGTRVKHVPWFIAGSLTSGFLWSRLRGNVPSILGACATRKFMYLVRGRYRNKVPLQSHYLTCGVGRVGGGGGGGGVGWVGVGGWGWARGWWGWGWELTEWGRLFCTPTPEAHMIYPTLSQANTKLAI